MALLEGGWSEGGDGCARLVLCVTSGKRDKNAKFGIGIMYRWGVEKEENKGREAVKYRRKSTFPPI